MCARHVPVESRGHGPDEAGPSRAAAALFLCLLQIGDGKSFPTVGKLFSNGNVRRKPCVFVRANPGRAASPLAAGERSVQADVFGCADAIRPRPRENRRPRFSGTSLRGSLFRRAGTARPTPSCSWEIARFSPDNSIGKLGIGRRASGLCKTRQGDGAECGLAGRGERA